MTPKDFQGKFSIPRTTNNFMFFPGSEEEQKPFDVYFYRRETENFSLDEFLASIAPENIGWDKPTKKLYYRSLDGILYEMNFKKVKN